MRLGVEVGMRSGACLALAVALGAWASPAAADWQYTQWGMSPDQVRAASDGAAAVNTDRNLDAAGLMAGLVAPYQGETLAFTAVFLFDGQDRLRYVTLKPVGKLSCPAIAQSLVAHYGPPGGRADMIRASTMRWDDAAGDNLVVYFDLGEGDCTVQYSKLPPTRPDGKGL